MNSAWFVRCLLLVLFPVLPAASNDLVHYAADDDYFSYAVAAERGDLIYTRQILCGEESGGEEMLEELSAIAGACGASLEHVVRLNFFLGDSPVELRKKAEVLIRNFWGSGKTPAVSFIPGALPDKATMACDAVIAPGLGDAEFRRFSKDGKFVDAVVAPAARDLVYASGRVAKGATYAESVPAAMDLILNDYIYPQGCQRDDIVQVRAYVHDIGKCEEARDRIEAVFEEGKAPPVVIIEWAREATVEIEVIASAPKRDSPGETVSFFTPKQFKPSPAFSRVAILHGKEIIFLSGMSGDRNVTPEDEVVSLFRIFQKRIEETGSDMSHLVKATYMVSDAEVDKTFSEIRLRYLHPERPPAASKVFRHAVGEEGRHLLIDMIATRSGDFEN